MVTSSCPCTLLPTKAKLGPGGPGGWTLKLPPADACTDSDIVCDVPQRLMVTKLGAPFLPSCLESCDGGGSGPRIAAGSCFFEQTCYAAGETAAFLGHPCQVCDPNASQTSFVEQGVGTDFCFIDRACYREGDPKRIPLGRGRFADSECEFCVPDENSNGWILREGFELIEQECSPLTTSGEGEPTPPPVDAPVAAPTTNLGDPSSGNALISQMLLCPSSIGVAALTMMMMIL